MSKWRDASKKIPKCDTDVCVLIIDHTSDEGEFLPIVTFGHYSDSTGWRDLKDRELSGDVLLWISLPPVSAKTWERRTGANEYSQSEAMENQNQES